MLALVLFAQMVSNASPPAQGPSFSHRHQVLFSVAPGIGFRSVFPYEDGQFCGDRKGDGRPERVCTNRIPWFLELELGFGIASQIDLIAAVRFAIETDFTRSHMFFVSPGIRWFLTGDSRFKVYSTFQLVFDKQDQSQPTVGSFDFALRNANGIQYEVARWLGPYLQIGETLGFVRWLRLELDVTFGVQARLF